MNATDRDKLKRRACARIDDLTPDLIDISRQIYENPEVAFQEVEAARLLSGVLEANGLAVERGVGDISTAFRGTTPGARPGPRIGLLSEYDALVGLGHGCGHHLIAISGVGGGLGVAVVADDLPGSVTVFGTPAEEGPSGKTILLSRGVFDGIDAAVLFHPRDRAGVLRQMRTGQSLRFTFEGRHAHAAADPDKAIDALNGVIALFNNVNLLRQHFRPDVSVTGNIPDGGSGAFPVLATARFGVRVYEGETDFNELREMIVDCARGAALATRTKLTVSYGGLERGMKFNDVLATVASTNAADHLGLDISAQMTIGGMSDFGNVSHRVPSVYLSTPAWPTGTTLHTEQAVELGATPLAFEAAINAAKIEAMIAIDLLTDPDLLAAAREDFVANDMGTIAARPA